MGFLSDAKDRVVEVLARKLANGSALARYGQLTALQLNSEDKSIDATFELRGEREPVSIRLEDYQVVEESGAAYVVVRRISTSREWLTALANDFAAGRRFKLPPEASGLLARCL